MLSRPQANKSTNKPTNQQTNKQMPESVQGFKKFESFCKIRPKRVRVEAKNGASIHEVVLENLHESQRFPNGFFLQFGFVRDDSLGR